MNIGIYIYDKVSVGIFRDCNVFTSNRYWGGREHAVKTARQMQYTWNNENLSQEHQ